MPQAKPLVSLFATVLLAAAPPAWAKDAPSRAPVKGCKWEKISDAKLGLEAWVQRCDFGFRKIDFLVSGSSLAVRYSDGGGEPDRLVDVIDLQPDESPEAGVKRVFAARTDKKIAARCVLAPYRGGKAPPGVKRFTFVPDTAYAKELKAKEDPNQVPDPPCGDFGTAPDGIQYFEVQPESAVKKVLFVRVGQDEPLFDERTLHLIAPR
jgi:hypothetical protein